MAAAAAAAGGGVGEAEGGRLGGREEEPELRGGSDERVVDLVSSSRAKKKLRNSRLVLALLTRPGGGMGGAEASPPRVRARGAALEHACWRRHGTTPGTDSKLEQTCGEAPKLLHSEHQGLRQLSCDEQRRRRLGEGAGAAARGAHTPRSPAAAVAWQARSSFASSARFTKLHYRISCQSHSHSPYSILHRVHVCLQTIERGESHLFTLRGGHTPCIHASSAQPPSYVKSTPGVINCPAAAQRCSVLRTSWQ